MGNLQRIRCHNISKAKVSRLTPFTFMFFSFLQGVSLILPDLLIFLILIFTDNNFEWVVLEPYWQNNGTKYCHSQWKKSPFFLSLRKCWSLHLFTDYNNRVLFPFRNPEAINYYVLFIFNSKYFQLSKFSAPLLWWKINGRYRTRGRMMPMTNLLAIHF